MLACTIYITGTRDFLPDESKVGKRFQREAFKDATEKLHGGCSISSSDSMPAASSSSFSATSISSSSSSSSAFPSSLPPTASGPEESCAASGRRVLTDTQKTGFNKMEYLHSHFYINIYEDEENVALNSLWLRPIIQIGEVVAGDEKVFHYTANHMNTKAVPQKKDVSTHAIV